MNVLVLGSDHRYESILHNLTTVAGSRVERLPVERVESTIIDAGEFAALICAGPVRPLFNQVRDFLSAGKPVMVIPAAVQGSDAAYELLASDEESGGRLVAGFPHRYDPRWRELRDRIRREDAAELQLIQVERQLTATHGSGVLPYSDIDEMLLCDADLLRWLGSDYTQVTCLHTGATDEGVTRATVALAGQSKPEATWTLESGAEGEQCRASVSAAGESFSISNMGPDSESANAEACAVGLLAELERVAGGQTADASWMEAVRAFDLVDAARRSIRRRRTVEISSGEVSERGQFKTKMTALGCSLLSLTFFGVLLALLIGAVFDPRDAMQRRSEAAGFVLERDAFVPETADLTDEGRDQLLELSTRLRETPAEIIVESTSLDSNAAADEERRKVVVDYLRAQRELELDGRVVVRPLAGRWFQWFMTGLWIAVFVPLGIFLILQTLIFVTQSPEGEDES